MCVEINILEVKERISKICNRIGRNPEEITLIAVSKTFPISKILELNRTGQIDFGENKVQELRNKYNNINLHSGKINWHMIGHLQTNKVKEIIAFIHLIQSVDSLKLAKEIDVNGKKINRVINVLMQVNTSEEEQKHGVSITDAKNLCWEISQLANVKMRGLMTMAVLTEDAELIRENFKVLKNLYDDLKKDFNDFEYLSMGMTNDYEIALEEGANMLRIGSAIFGERIIN